MGAFDHQVKCEHKNLFWYNSRQEILTVHRDFNLRGQKTGRCTSSCEFGSQGGSGAFCLKMCDSLAQQDKFSTTLQSILVVCKVCNECNLS